MELEDCDLCIERAYAKQPVPGEGPLDSAVCFLGRNPGRQEDREGRPFRGPAGKLLDNYFPTNLRREKCRITNVSKCMTPGGVAPSKKCQEMCRETWLAPELNRMKNLRLIVTLGNDALKQFFRNYSVGQLHGVALTAGFLFAVPERASRMFVSYHPSYALRSIYGEKVFEKDMKKLEQLVNDLGVKHEHAI